MHINIETSQLDLPANTRSNLKMRILKRMGRLAQRVVNLQVTLADTNGQRGGRDKLCTLTAKLTAGRQIVVTQQSHTAAHALFRAVRRLRRLVSKQPRQPKAARRRDWSAASA